MVALWARPHLNPHPIARHTWTQQLKEPDSEYYDDIPYSPDGTFHTPTGKPRHRAWQVDDHALFTNQLVEGKQFPSGPVVIVKTPNASTMFTVAYVDDDGTGEFGVEPEELSNP